MTTPVHGLADIVFDKRRLQQQQLAEITEMIHVSDLILCGCFILKALIIMSFSVAFTLCT
jgi:hypothetical protein